MCRPPDSPAYHARSRPLDQFPEFPKGGAVEAMIKRRLSNFAIAKGNEDGDGHGNSETSETSETSLKHKAILIEVDDLCFAETGISSELEKL